jgi:hypothetical protein
MAVDPRLEEIRRQREQDWSLGYGKGQELFKDKSLGRLGDIPDIQKVMEARRLQSAGMTPDEQNVARAKLMSQIGSANQGAVRQLRGIQGASGVQGAAAGAQAADVLKGGQQAMIGAERDLQMQNLLMKRQGLSDLETSALGLGKFDIGQANKERMGAIYTGLGEQMLGSTERAAIQNADIAREQQAAANDGGKK